MATSWQGRKEGSLKLALVLKKSFWSHSHIQSFTTLYLGIAKNAVSQNGVLTSSFPEQSFSKSTFIYQINVRIVHRWCCYVSISPWNCVSHHYVELNVTFKCLNLLTPYILKKKMRCCLTVILLLDCCLLWLMYCSVEIPAHYDFVFKN